MVREIAFDEHPAPAKLGAGEQPLPRATAHLLRMQLEEARGLTERERQHVGPSNSPRRL